LSTLQCANIIFESTANNRLQYLGSNNLAIVTSGSNVMYIAANGNIGINTTTPNTALHIGSSNSSVTSAISFSDNSMVGTAASLGMRNRLINGAFDIWQRGTSFSNMSSSNTYVADRWSCYRQGYTANCTVSQVTGLSINGINRNALRMQRTAGDTSTQALNITQALESINSRDLAGQTVTLSFWARAGANFSPTSSQVLAVIQSGTGTDETIRNGFTGGTPLSSSNITLTTSFQKFALTGTTPSNCNQIGINLYWTPTGTAGAADYVDIIDVQLEAGSVATPFERRQYGQELYLCQRYYQLLTNPKLNGVMGGATSVNRMGCNLLQPMRTTPTSYTLTGTIPIYNGGTVGTVTAIGVPYYSINTLEFDATAATGSYAQYQPITTYQSGTYSIGVNAEL